MSTIFEQAERYLPTLFSKSNRSGDNEELQSLFSLLKLNQNLETAEIIAQFSNIWNSFLDLDGNPTKLPYKDRPAQIALLSALYRIHRDNAVEVRSHYLKSGRWYERSIAELKLRLSGRLYKYARRIWRNFKNTADTRACLEFSIEVSNLSTDELTSLKDGALKVHYGFRGASREILGRLRATDFDFWQRAYQDMSHSYTLGNRSKEAKEFLRAIAANRFEKHDTLEHFNDTLTHFKSYREDDDQAIGELLQVAASAAPRFALQSHIAAFFTAMAGERLASHALKIPGISTESTHIPFLKQQRAFFSMVMLQNCPGLSDELLEPLLEDNIADFKVGWSVGIGGASLHDALLRRAVLKIEQGKLSEVKVSLEELRALRPEIANADVRANIENRASSIETRLIFEVCNENGDYSSAIRAASTSTRHLPYAYHNYFAYLQKLKQVIESLLFTPSIDDRRTLRKFLQSICEAPEKIEPEKSIEFILSFAAGLSRAIDQQELTALTLRLYAEANRRATANKLEVSSFAGNIFLQAGKQDADIWQADTPSLFENAVSLFEECLDLFENTKTEHSEAFVPRVVFSKAGEAHLRLAKYRLPSISNYERAFELFERSVGLGNSSPEIFGLMGDAKYRIAISSYSETEFVFALDLKTRAREKGNRSRENFSVSARISERLFQVRGDMALLSTSLSFAIKAIAADRNWAWPYIQIWELMKRNQTDWDLVVEGASLSKEIDPHLINNIESNNPNFIIEEGVRKTISSDEFRRKDLGGRSNVFLVDDPHGLLGATVVLKPTTMRNARRETAEAMAVNKLIEAAGEHERFSVIEPMCTVEEGSQTIMALRYAEGSTLAQRILRAQALGNSISAKELVRISEFLALFQKPTLDTKNDFDIERLCGFFSPLRHIAGKHRLKAAFEGMGFQRLPAVRKKDAHAENWIIGLSDKVTMLDLEASRMQPVFADLSQLFDDFPACSPDTLGWNAREETAKAYIKAFEDDIEVDLPLRPILEVFAIWRASVMLPFIRGKQRDERSISALQAYQTRQEHLELNMAFLSENASLPYIAEIARLVGDKFRPDS